MQMESEREGFRGADEKMTVFARDEGKENRVENVPTIEQPDSA